MANDDLTLMDRIALDIEKRTKKEITSLKSENAALRKIAVAAKEMAADIYFVHKYTSIKFDRLLDAYESQRGPLQAEKGGE